MTDSVAVFIPGYRLTDSATGAPIVGATIAFYDAGTTNPKTVYSDSTLLTAIGTSVITDALGCPTSDGSTKTDVFVGTSPYKVVISNASAVVIETKDNRPGAVVSASSVNTAVTALFPVVTKSLNYTVLQADQNTTFKVNCTSGDVTLTLPSAVAGAVTATGNVSAAGWKIKVAHAGTANQVLLVVASGSGQTISEGSKSFGGGYALAVNGEDIEIASDGGNWLVSSHTAPFVKLAQGVIPITSRLATSPGSPVQGALYILTGTGGSWSTFSSSDIAQYTGVGWINFTPYTDCGWIAYNAADDRNYQFVNSAWVAQPLSTPATQTTMEAATAGTPVTADMQQFHPSAPKVWGQVTVSGGTPTMNGSYNMTSITDAGVGLLTITIATDFSSAAWAAAASIVDTTVQQTIRLSTQSAGATQAACEAVSGGSLRDPGGYFWSGMGDQ
jgi:Protein of unknown function (DUF2793)